MCSLRRTLPFLGTAPCSRVSTLSAALSLSAALVRTDAWVTLPFEFRRGSNEFTCIAARARLWCVDAGGNAAGPRRRHFRYSRRSAFQSGQACEDNRVLQERGGDREDRRR